MRVVGVRTPPKLTGYVLRRCARCGDPTYIAEAEAEADATDIRCEFCRLSIRDLGGDA